MNWLLVWSLTLCFLFSLNGETFNEFDDYQDENIGDSTEIDVDSLGSSRSWKKQPPQSPDKVSVTFENHYQNETIQLFWVSEKGEEFLIGDIPIDESIRVDTTLYHTFSAKGSESSFIANPPLITVKPNKRAYSFEPFSAFSSSSTSSFTKSSSLSAASETIPAPKPFIKVLNRASTSCNAKFRNHVPNAIDIWYDDGRDGTYQGTLDLGKEYTVNSYVGHVFYFTEKGNKSKVYIRHTVAADKVDISFRYVSLTLLMFFLSLVFFGCVLPRCYILLKILIVQLLLIFLIIMKKN
jgi:hypothetical protein